MPIFALGSDSIQWVGIFMKVSIFQTPVAHPEAGILLLDEFSSLANR